MVLVVAVVVVGAIFAEKQNQEVFLQQQRNIALDELALVRSKLESDINRDTQLVRGLVAVIAAEPDISRARFSVLSSELLTSQTHLRNVTAAPNFVVSLVFPSKGNEQVLGLNYLESETQRELAVRARDTGNPVIAGPVNLVQGGKGLILRVPVYKSDRNGSRAFWGLVSCVIDLTSLYESAGIGASSNLDVVIIGADAKGKQGRLFYGNASVLVNHPIMATVQLPSGSWHMAAIPKDGWAATPPDIWQFRAKIALAMSLVLLPMIALVRLIGERARHIGQLKAREDEMNRLSQRLNLAIDASQIGVWEYDVTTGVLEWDDRMHELYRAGEKPLSSDLMAWFERMHPDDKARVAQEFDVAMAQDQRCFSQFRIQHPQGGYRHIRSVGMPYRDAQGSLKLVGVNWDVSVDVNLNQALEKAKELAEARNLELETAKAHIEYTAQHDVLTGLPNRRYLDTVLQSPQTWRRDFSGNFALLHLDLDRFKQINDTLGHAIGDAMLAHAAGVLKTNAGPNDFVARIGGDEFVILTTDTNHAGSVTDMADAIIEAMCKPIAQNGIECRIGVSIGIAENPVEGCDLQRLLMNADIALYRAKTRGRNRCEVFTKGLESEIVTAKKIGDEILEAIEQNQFVTHYQPQFDAASRNIVGVEALVRWQHPERGLLSPVAFLEVAEDINALAAIDKLVLAQALKDQKQWDEAGVDIPRISVNVSARRLQDEQLIKSLDEMNIAPGRITFELVESVFLDEREDIVSWNIDHIRERGIDIEIDDFGTGYASIVSVMKLRPKRLKIDRQLVLPITASKAQKRLLASIIEIAQSLGVDTVAEGVETFEHADILNGLGCNVLQGFAFGRPMSSVDLLEFVRGESWRLAS